MPRAVTALAVALLTLVGTAALALAQGGPAPLEGGTPTRGALYEDGSTGRFILGGRWHFLLDPADQGEAAGLPANPSLDGWTPTRVPNAWNTKDHSDDSQRGTIGWYRKDFRVPSKDAAFGWKLRFESVNYRAKVWLNGIFLGEHEFGYVPFELPTTGLVRDGVNRLVVRVDNRRTRADIPRGYERPNGRPGGGWWNYGGILREVYLRRYEGVDIESVRTDTEIGGTQERAWVRVRARLGNPGTRDTRFRVRWRFGERERFSRPITVRAGTVRTVRRTFEVTDPQLWYPGAPRLYPVGIDAVDGERSLAGYRLNVGIREIRVTDDGLLLINGHRVKLFGASIHEERAARGAALTPANRERDLELYRELGATLMRAHYPLHPRHLELADRLGVMVWDEVPVFAQGYKAFETPGLTDKALSYIRQMVDRDRNHASVLAWSIANELSGRMTEDQEDYIHRAAQLLRGLDPTRLRTIVIFGWPQAAPFDVYHELDAIGINSYFGWYAGPNGSTEDRKRLSPFLDQMREYYPELALFVTEFGAESNRKGPADQKGTYAFQRDLLTHHVRTYIKKPWLSGAIAWVMRDFRSRPDWEGGSPTPRTGWNQKGLLDYRSRKKPVFNPVARLYKSVPPVAARPYPFATSR